MPPFPPGILLAALLLTATDPQTDDELAEHVTQAFDAHLTVRDPWFTVEGAKVTEVTVLLDGHELGACRENPRERSELCFAPVRLVPGDHILELRLLAKHAQTLAPLQLNGSERFSARPHDSLTFSISGSVQPGAKQEAYLQRAAPTRPHSSPCLEALESLATAATCTHAELRAFAPRLEAVRAACSAGAVTTHWAYVLARRAAHNLFDLELARCRTPEERQKLSARLTDRWGGERLWPRDTVRAGSWVWARETPSGEPAEGLEREKVLASIASGLPRVLERVGVVEELLGAELEPRLLPALLSRVQARPFSFDPRSPNGHLWYSAAALVEKGKPPAPPEFIAALARNVEQDPTLSCGLDKERDLLVRTFLKDERLSSAEWKAVTAMVTRTPEDSALGRCEHAMDPRLSSEVSATDRARWLATFDCSSRRHPKLRGEAFRAMLRLASGDQKVALEPVAASYKECVAP